MEVTNKRTIIGQGGFGKVFKIFDDQDNKYYAIKETIENDKLSKSRFITEASNWFLFRSVPQVVEIFEILNEDNKIRIKMEFMQNGSLRNYINNKKFSFNDRIIALYDILMALINCKGIDNNFCHLDIKPENCLISKYGLTKLSDFGSSIINENNLENEIVNDIHNSILDSNNYGIIGTPLYMAPEQIKGLPDIGIKSDIYSFGLMAIETLNAIHPFFDIGNDNIYEAHIKGLFKKNFKLSKKIPKPLRKILIKTIESNPKRRPNLLQIETAFFKSMNSKLKHRKGVNKRLPDYVDDAIRKSKSLIAISKFVKAEKVLLDALEFNPYNAEAWCDLGLIKSNRIRNYNDVHSLSSSLDCFIRALIINNGNLSEKYSSTNTDLLINLLETDKYNNYELEDLMILFRDKNSKWLINKEKEYYSKTYNKEYCLCVKCGEMKDYIFDRCSSCGYLPHTDNDVFNSHNLKVRRIKDDISTNLYIKSKYLRSIGKNISEFVSDMEKDKNYGWLKKEFYDSKSGLILKKMAKADSSWITDWIDMIQNK